MIRLLFLVLTFFCFKSYSQEILKYSPYQGSNSHLYIGSVLYVKQDKAYNLINKVFHTLNDARYKKVAFPISIYETSRDSLLGNEIKVIDIVDIDGNKVLKGEDKDIFFKCDFKGSPLYIKYISNNKYNFPFDAVLTVENTVIEKDIHLNRYKKSLQIDKDDFTQVVTVFTPYVLEPVGNVKKNNTLQDYSSVGLYKEFSKKNEVSYYIRLYTRGFEYDVAKRGVIILFTDGSRLEKPNAYVDVSTGYGRMFSYTAVIKLSASDINALSNKKIKKYRLYRHDEEINEEDATHLTQYMKELTRYKL